MTHKQVNQSNSRQTRDFGRSDDSTQPLGILKSQNAASHGDHFARIRIPKGQELRSGERKQRFLATLF